MHCHTHSPCFKAVNDVLAELRLSLKDQNHFYPYLIVLATENAAVASFAELMFLRHLDFACNARQNERNRLRAVVDRFFEGGDLEPNADDLRERMNNNRVLQKLREAVVAFDEAMHMQEAMQL